MTTEIIDAKIYGLIEMARLRMGPAINSMSAASAAAARGNTGDDTRDAIGVALLLLQDASALLLEADRASREARA